MSKAGSSRLSGMMRNLKIVYGDKDRKALGRIAKEFIIASYRTKSLATYYFTSFLYKNFITNYLDFISHKEWQYMQRAICDRVTYVILGDKLYFHEYYDKFKIPMPKLLAYSIREKIFVNDVNDWISHDISTPETLNSVLSALISKAANKAIFVKPTVSSGGQGIVRFSDQHGLISTDQTNRFLKNFLSGAFIYQEEVKQHSNLALLNPNSANTIRIDTFKAKGKIPEVISAYLRIGRGHGFVDNLTSGGLRVGINMENGCLKTHGTNYIYLGASFLTHHPDTGIQFEDYPIPFFEEVKSLAIKAASCLPQSLVGWDVAITEHGPVLIEGNTVYYNMSGADIAYGGYRNNPVYRKVTDYVKNVLKK